MPYELVKVPNKQCKILWIMLGLFFCTICIFYRFNYSSSEHFSEKDKKISSSTNLSKSITPIPTIPKPTIPKPTISKPTQNKSKNKKLYPKSYNLGVCSKNCCSTQWPVPIDFTEKSKVNPKTIGKKYFKSNLTCNNGIINTGCVCLTNESKKVLENRGYVNNLSMGNGLLEQDNKKSAFKIMEDKIPRPVNILGQTTELTGDSKPKYTSGKLSSSIDNRLDSYRSIESEKEIANKFTMPINYNTISFDNEAINEALYNSNISGNKLSPTERLISNPIGIRTQSMSIRR